MYGSGKGLTCTKVVKKITLGMKLDELELDEGNTRVQPHLNSKKHEFNSHRSLFMDACSQQKVLNWTWLKFKPSPQISSNFKVSWA